MATRRSLTKTSRCRPGYEPVPGKSEHEEGSCRKKPKSRNGGKEVDCEAARKAQIKRGGKRGAQAKAKSAKSSIRNIARKSKQMGDMRRNVSD
jgi:hypothetical protein